jgi:hypothetical protein
VAQQGSGVAQQGGGVALQGCGVAQQGCGVVARRAAVRRPRVRISARHPSGGPLLERTAMRKQERNSANVMNEVLCMNV